jgi:two-component system, OmpR family, response regulator ChvI
LIQKNNDDTNANTNNNDNLTTKQQQQGKKSISRRILLVDDEPDITVSIKMGLEDTGLFAVDVFNEAKLALANFKPNFYDLYLIDIKMPQMNGFELYQKIKSIEGSEKEEEEKKKRKPHVKACFITAYEIYYETLKKEFPTLNVGCFIKKPIDVKELINRIKEEVEM